MSENQDPKPAAEEQAAGTPVAQPEEKIPGPGEERTPEEQLASAHAQLLAAQQQMHDAQQRLMAAQEALDAKLREQGRGAPQPSAQPAQAQGLMRRPRAAPQHLISSPDSTPEDAPETAGVATGEAAEATDAVAESHGQPQLEHVNSPEPEEQPQETEAAQPAAGYGPLNGIFAGLAALGPITLLVLLGCMAWPIFLEPSMATYCPAELKSITAFLHAIANNSWFTPMALGDSGAFSDPQWPLFTWCLGLLALVPQLANGDWILPIASFGGTFLAAFGVWALAMAAGFGALSAMAAGIIVLCAPLFAPLPHFVGPAALAAGLMLLALSCFCKGWMTPRSWLALPLGFIFTALAGLAGGLLHFAVPLIASFFFLLWRADFKRAQHLDALMGFIIMLAIAGAWLGVVMAGDDKSDYLNLLFAGAFQYAWPPHLLWTKPIAAGLLGLLPWLLIIFAVAWFRVLGHSARTLGASRRENGSAMVWISLVLALVMAVFIPWFHPAAIAICCLGAVLLGKAFINLGDGGNRFFFLLAALLLIFAGAIAAALSFSESQSLILGQLPFLASIPDLGPRLLGLDALKIVGGIIIAGGLLAFLFVRRCMGCGGLVYAALLVIALSLAAKFLLVPQLQAMPATPLVTYATVEERVIAAMKAPASPAPGIEAQEQTPAPSLPAVPPAGGAPEAATLVAPEASAAAPDAQAGPAPAEPPAQETADTVAPAAAPGAPAGSAKAPDKANAHASEADTAHDQPKTAPGANTPPAQ